MTPRAPRNEITAVIAAADGQAALGMRVAAPPADGTANETLRRLLRDATAVPLSDIRIHAGERSRLKIVELTGNGPEIALRFQLLLSER